MSWPGLPRRSTDGPDLYTFGEVMVLLRGDVDVPLRSVWRFHRDLAGAEGNVAVGVARLGHRVSLAVRVGADPFGDVVVAALRAEGIDVTAITDPDRPTGLMMRDVFAERRIEVVYHRAGSAAAAMSPADLDRDRIAAATVLHLTGITPVLSDSAADAAYEAVATARRHGTTVSFDPNLRRRLADPATAVARWTPIIEQSDIVLAGREEAEAIVGSDDRRRTAEWFAAQGVGLLVVKDGAAGAWASDGEHVVEQPAVAVRTVDPVGAGDAFAAGLLGALLDGADVETAMRSGAIVAACAVQVAGDIGGLPTGAQLRRLMAVGDSAVDGVGR